MNEVVEQWYIYNQDWVDNAYIESLMIKHGYDVTENCRIDLTPTDDFIEKMYKSF